MGFLRNTALILITSLLLFSLILLNLSTTISWSLEHETLYPEMQEIAKKTLEEYNLIPNIEKDFQKIEMDCFNQEFFAYNSGEYSLKIPCEIINKGYNETIFYGIGMFINETYYKEYDCDILECIKEKNQPLVLISEKTKNFFKDKSKTLLIFSMILILLIILLSKRKHNAFITIGILAIISALPFRELKWLSSLFQNSVVFEFIGLFFTRSNSIYIIMLIVGISFLILGITFFLLKYGLKISNWFKKKEEQIQKDTENMKKENMEENKISQEKNMEEKTDKDSKKDKIEEKINKNKTKKKNNKDTNNNSKKNYPNKK